MTRKELRQHFTDFRCKEYLHKNIYEEWVRLEEVKCLLRDLYNYTDEQTEDLFDTKASLKSVDLYEGYKEFVPYSVLTKFLNVTE